MGNKITKENSNGQITFIGSSDNSFKQHLKKYIYEINDYENLKRACCLRDSDGGANITIPIINDNNKTYTTIEVEQSLNDNLCRFDDNGLINNTGNLYKPSTKTQEDTQCKIFYTNYCSNVYDQRHLDGHRDVLRNYTDKKKLNWFSDCNCINSTISASNKKTKTGHKISTLSEQDYPTELRMPNVFDTFCRDGSDLFLTKPFRSQKDFEDTGKSITVCKQNINVNADKIGKDLKLNNINLKMACGEKKTTDNSGSKETKGANRTNERDNSNNSDNETNNESDNNDEIKNKKKKLEKSGTDILTKMDDMDDDDPNLKNIENKVQDIIDNIKNSSTESDFNSIIRDIDNTIDEIDNLPNKEKYNDIVNELEDLKDDLKIKKNNYFKKFRNKYEISNMKLIMGFFSFIFIIIILYLIINILFDDEPQMYKRY